MEVTTIGLDLGKDVFQVHGVTADGTVAFNRTIRRRQLLKFFETPPSCLVGIEACGSAHHWARELTEIGHDVRLMPATYVKPYVKLCAASHNLTYHQVVIMHRSVGKMHETQAKSAI